jgi:hypothetical protein
MLRAMACAVLGLALTAGGLQAQAKKDAKTDPKDAKLIEAKVKAVDNVKGTLTVTTADGKEMTFKVEKDTKIVGPRGGTSEDRLKDDRLAKGSEVKIVASADGKTAKEVRLGFRKKAPEKDKKDKPKDKEK